MNTSYDTLTITINADSKQANASIKALYTNLRNLEETAKNLDDKRIVEVKKLLQGIAKIDFSNVSKGLQDVVNAFKAFQSKSFQKAMSGEGLTGALKDQEEGYVPNWEMKSWAYSNDTSLTVIKEMRGEVEALNEDLTSNAKTWQETIEGLDKQLPSVILSFREMKEEAVDLEDVLKGEGFNGDQIRKVMSAIHQELKNLTPEQLEKLRDILTQFGASAEQADNIVKSLAKDANKLDSGAKKGANGLKKLANQFKNIMKYRIIRKIIQEIYKALTEGIKNVIAFDKATSDTINELKSKFEFVKNSLSAMLAPLIQMVAPILNTIMTMVGELGNTFAEIFAGANGQTQFAKASDDLRDFNEEAKKTQTLGIDELNVFRQDDSGGFTTEQVNLGKEENELASALKDTFKVIKDLFADIFGKAKELVNKVLPKVANVLKPIINIISNIFKLVTKLFDDTIDGAGSNLDNILTSVADILNLISTLVDVLMPVLEEIIGAIAIFTNTINGSVDGTAGTLSIIATILEPILKMLEPLLIVLGAIMEIINGIAGGIASIANGWLNTIISLIATIFKTIKAFFEGDFQTINQLWEEFGNKFKSIWVGVGNFFVKVLNGLLEKVENFLNFFVDNAGKVAEFFGADTSNWGVHIPRIPEISYANGGFPEDGMFFANHNELVGQFSNGQTAVANNEQIIEGIYRGVLQAMRDSGANGNGEIVVNLDGYEIARAVTKQQKNMGADLVAGANIAWGK